MASPPEPDATEPEQDHQLVDLDLTVLSVAQREALAWRLEVEGIAHTWGDAFTLVVPADHAEAVRELAREIPDGRAREPAPLGGPILTWALLRQGPLGWLLSKLRRRPRPPA